MDEPSTNMVSLFVYIIVLLLFGTFFYTSVEHWKLLDSLYFTVTTLATVGFGDLTPKTDIGKIFTIMYIMIGVGLLLGFVSYVAHHTRETDPVLTLFKKLRKK